MHGGEEVPEGLLDEVVACRSRPYGRGSGAHVWQQHGKPKGRHPVVSGHAAAGINERQMGAAATGKKPKASVTRAQARRAAFLPSSLVRGKGFCPDLEGLEQPLFEEKR
jgi:hypothetical protein